MEEMKEVNPHAELAKQILINDGKAMLYKLLDEVALPALKEAVAKTATPLDDLAVNTLAPVMIEQIKAKLG